MGRPSDSAQPNSKRRPGEQLTKDDIDDDDEVEGPVGTSSTGSLEAQIDVSHCHHDHDLGPVLVMVLCVQAVDPGNWGKADQATMAKRKVVRVRRGAGAAGDPVAAAAGDAGNAAVTTSNPFAGVSLTAPAAIASANPFAAAPLLTSTLAGQAQVRPWATQMRFGCQLLQLGMQHLELVVIRAWRHAGA